MSGPLRSFGRIKARPIKPRQAALMETLLPEIVVPDPKAGPLDPKTMMSEATEVWLEIGFGGGEHMVAMAALYPEIGIIGCEPFINGVAMLLGKIRAAGVTNVSVHPGDARDLMDVFPDFEGLGGIGDLEEVIGALLTFVLIIAVLMLIISGIVWAIASASGNYAAAGKARTGVLVAVGTAALAGCGVAWLNWLIALGDQI